MGWRILYIEESDFVSLYLDNIKVRKATVEMLFPLSDILLVMIDNYKTTVTTNLLLSCSANNIPVICCGDNHHPFNILLPLFGHFEASKILLQQISWNQSDKEALWKLIVKRKITNQHFVLEKSNPNYGGNMLLKKYIDEVEDGDATNREGLAAKVYFRGLFGEKFNRRDDTTINACLNFGYSIFRSLISKIIVAKGLNPQLGIFHKGPTNYFNLSDDLLEIFRPIIDLFVFENFLNEKIFVKEHRKKLLSLLNNKIEINGQKHTINHCIEKIVDNVIDFFKNGSVGTIINFDPIAYDI